MTDHRLGYLTRREIRARAQAGAVGLLPVGSLEQHGDHLPILTDSLLAETLCLRAAAQTEVDVLVAPALWSGFSPHHVRFGSTVSLSGATFATLVREAVAGLRTFLPHVLVVNGHGGNRGPLITLSLEEHWSFVSYWELASAEAARFTADGGSIGHAGQAETSMVLAAFPELAGEPSREFEPPKEGDPLLLPDFGDSGVIGDPYAASAEAGEAFLSEVARELARRVEQLSTQVVGV